MSLNLEKFLKKGLQSNLSSKSIDDCCLVFTTDTKRLYIEDGTSRNEITDIIYGMTESQIINNASLLPKFYIASDTLAVYVSDGTSVEKVNYKPVAINDNISKVYNPVMRSTDGTVSQGYTSQLSFNPSNKETIIGDMRIAQSTDSNTGDKTVNFYIVQPNP
jgi:hypothetical protein